MKYLIYTVLFTLHISTIAYSQQYFGLLQSRPHSVNMSVGAAPHLDASIGYLYASDSLRLGGLPVGIAANIAAPLFSQQSGFDASLRAGAGVLVPFGGAWKMLTGLSWGLHRTEDISARYWTTGLKLDLYPGWYGQSWMIAPHLALDYRPLVHLEHKEYARQAFQNLYPNANTPQREAQNGWFSQQFFLTQTGVSAAYFQERWNINVVMGLQQHWNRLGILFLPDVGLMPIYGVVGASFAL